MVTQTRVVLRAPDSTERFYQGYRAGGRFGGGELQLVGAAADGARAEVERGSLFLGCRACTDASPDSYRIVMVSPDGFWGRWFNPQSGIGLVIGKDGKPLPDPAGYFCALRVRA